MVPDTEGSGLAEDDDEADDTGADDTRGNGNGDNPVEEGPPEVPPLVGEALVDDTEGTFELEEGCAGELDSSVKEEDEE